MSKINLTYTVTLIYSQTIDTETGEVLENKLINKSVSSEEKKATKSTTKPKKDESSEPQLILGDNKYTLNTAAIELMGVAADDKIDIKYEKRGKVMVPVIGSDTVFGTKGGCRLTKTNTVSCRGSKHDELSKYGEVFTLKPHDKKDGLFLLMGPEDTSFVDPVEMKEDEAVSFPDDIDLKDLVDGADVTEVSASMFTLQ